MKINKTSSKQSPSISILGSRQLTGLGSKLLQSRYESKLGQYTVSAIVKPNATTDEILKECCNIEDSPDNFLVVCAGEHDRNPTKVLIEFASALKRFKFINIIVINVINNNYLNISKLNSCISDICRNLTNCNFIEICKGKTTLNNGTNLNLTCDKINLLIDYHNYKNRYLTPSSLREIIRKNFSNKGKGKKWILPPVKGTIPYYFPLLVKNISTKQLTSPQKRQDFLLTTNHLSLEIN